MCAAVQAGSTAPPQGDQREQAIRKRMERLNKDLEIYCKPLWDLDYNYNDFKYEVNRFLKPRVRPELPKAPWASSLYYLYGYLLFGNAWPYSFKVHYKLDDRLAGVINDTSEEFMKLKLYSAREVLSTCKKTMSMKVEDWGKLGEFIEKLASEGYEGFGRILGMTVGGFVSSFPIPSSIQEAPRDYYHQLRDLVIEYVMRVPPLGNTFEKHIRMLLKWKLGYSDKEIEEILRCIRGC